MKEIKITISKGGKLKMMADKSSAAEQAAFTEKLAKELGTTEERHKGGSYNTNESQNNVQQGH